jgi:hypothetical protein
MTVYPDGEALSDWELEILEEMEWELAPHPAPLYMLAACVVAAEATLAVAVLTVSMVGVLAGLTTIGTSLWATSVDAEGRGAIPGRARSARL